MMVSKKYQMKWVFGTFILMTDSTIATENAPCTNTGTTVEPVYIQVNQAVLTSWWWCSHHHHGVSTWVLGWRIQLSQLQFKWTTSNCSKCWNCRSTCILAPAVIFFCLEHQIIRYLVQPLFCTSALLLQTTPPFLFFFVAFSTESPHLSTASVNHTRMFAQSPLGSSVLNYT